jgi:hypothetical protein
VLVEKKVVMRYPDGDETRKEKSHDYKGYYPAYFLYRGDHPAGDTATSASQAIPE